MFNFRIINIPDGNQIIDHSLKTPYESLTPVQMEEYEEMDREISWIERQKRKEQKEAERRRKLAKNPFVRFICLCGLVERKGEESNE